MVDFKALLIGIPHYDDVNIDDLPFVADDLRDLERTLTAAGYQVDVHDPAQTDRDRMDRAIEQFCRQASRGEQLLILLSGHGIHRNGADYLIPSSADTRSKKFVERCLAIGFREYVEDSQCGNVLIVVDACREGVHLQEKGSYAVGWSRRTQENAGNRTITYLYACSEGEWARYVTSNIGSYSVLSRAFSMVATDDRGPATLDGVFDAIALNVEDITSQNSLPRQRVQLIGDVTRARGFVVFGNRQDSTGASGLAEHAWVKAVRDYPTWSMADEDTDLRDDVVTLVAGWARRFEESRKELVGDSWWDDAFAVRVSERLGWLLSRVLNPEKLVSKPGRPSLSPAEAALLAVFPFVHAVFWVQTLAELSYVTRDSGGDPAIREEFERFIQAYPRLVRRMDRLKSSGEENADDLKAQSDMRWWLYHRWVIRRAGTYSADAVQGALLLGRNGQASSELLSEIFDHSRIGMLIKSQRMTASEVVRADFPGQLLSSRAIAMSTAQEQQIREQLVGLLLITANLLAIDPVDLSSVIAEHVGIGDPVNIGEALKAIRDASWRPRGRTRVLNAECAHQAIDVALTEHAARLTGVLQEIDSLASEVGALAPLVDLPTHASADEVRAAAGSDGRPMYDGQGFRFRLADDRIQELLMGEQLYGDPALAVRELYQNSLDACRYRAARLEYLRKSGSPQAEWAGEIVFRHGVDESGRPYLDCVDNGIGMRRRDLTDVFSNAGVRFADLPEFIEEQGCWKEMGIEFHPTSYFGIGVLSYFMIADEIIVTTCRLGRSGKSGNLLRVSIPGPGALSRIQDLGEGQEAGTTVRLLLRPNAEPVSCVELLSRLLWISEFSVAVIKDDEVVVKWEPRELSSIAPVGAAADKLGNLAVRTATSILRTSSPDVWWCDTAGSVLSDGLRVDFGCFGAVVNLAGASQPKLTVDRRRVVDLDVALVARMLGRELDAITTDGVELRNHGWIGRLGRQWPLIADELASRVVQDPSVLWKVAGRWVDLSVIGCFTQDDVFFREQGYGDPSIQVVINAVPKNIATWRLLAWVKAGLLADFEFVSSETIPVARPSDQILLLQHGSSLSSGRLGRFYASPLGAEPWLDPDVVVSVGHIVTTSTYLEMRPAEVAERLVSLGYVVVDFDWSGIDSDVDVSVLSADLDGKAPWLPVETSVNVAHVVSFASRSGHSLSDVVDQLREFGHVVNDFDLSIEFESSDLALMGERNMDDRWLSMEHPVDIGHIYMAAEDSGLSLASAARRLAKFGYTVPDIEWETISLSHDDLVLISEDHDATLPWLSLGQVVDLSHIYGAAVVVDWTPFEVGERLKQFGFAVKDFYWSAFGDGDDDAVLVSCNLDATGYWLSLDEVVPLGHVLAAADELRRTPEAISRRLVELGYSVSELPLGKQFDRQDAILLSRSCNRKYPWILLDERVSIGHVMSAASVLRCLPNEVVDRLGYLGWDVEDFEWSKCEPAIDSRLLSVNLDGKYPWLDLSEVVPARHLLAAADELSRSLADIAGRLIRFGCHLAPEIRLKSDAHDASL